MATRILFAFLFLGSLSFKVFAQNIINLAGQWQFQLDTAGVGEKERWQNKTLNDVATLPGTLDENQKSYTANYSCNCLINVMNFGPQVHCDPYKDSSSFHYTRKYAYTGKAWFRKELNIPESMVGKHIELTMERSKVTKIWIDNQFVGYSKLLSAAQVYDLTGKLTVGKHTITIMVDNNPKLVPTGLSHIYSYDIQTNWNGILGKFQLEAKNWCHIEKFTVYPDIHKNVAAIKIQVKNDGNKAKKLTFSLKASSWNYGVNHEPGEQIFNVNISTSDSVYEFIYNMGSNPLLWSEYNPSIYSLEVAMSNKKELLDKQNTNFGMREFKTRGTQFEINGSIVFLRGKHDGCVFPLTGHPPMDTTEWCRYFRIAKSYGINHIRFHSWCPPKMAFLAADIVGMYLQAELPYWGEYKEADTTLVQYMTNEAINILGNNGNSPSFVMMALGNELGGSRTVMDNMVARLKQFDNRHLYSFSTNGIFWDPQPGANDDFWPTMFTAVKDSTKPPYTRLTYSTGDAKNGGLLNTNAPSTNFSFYDAIKSYQLPIIGHEVAQYQVYPNFNEIQKFTGVLKPISYEIYRSRLKRAGMLDQANDFFRSTGQSCLIMYRAEIEAAMRTPGFGGFQLLDLQDYPGQGTALVGILDAFMDSKGIITPQKYREFCNDVVPLLLMDRYSWTNDMVFSARIQIANYSPLVLTGKSVSWKIISENNKTLIDEGVFKNASMEKGKLSNIGIIQLPLSTITSAQRLNIFISIDGTDYKNEYPLWVYPSEINTNQTGKVIVTNELNESLYNKLAAGASVLYFPDHEKIKDKSVGSQFINEFWNWLMFKGICERGKKSVAPGTLGILVDPQHPMFADFPTEMHSNWQWWPILTNSRPFILDSTDFNYRPIIQSIDNVDRNHKLGIAFELKCGKGKILVCTANLPGNMDKPEVKQLYYSIFKYMNSEKFEPNQDISVAELNNLLN